jgi:hypothetical protein
MKPDREKVIKELEEVQHYIKVENLPAHTLKAKLVIDDALALLKAQEPRVMTLEEIKALPDYVFLEDRDISHVFSIKTISRPALPQLVFVNISGEECVGFRGPDGDTSLVTSRYRVEWRCWTSRPTDEQREAVKWE